MLEQKKKYKFTAEDTEELTAKGKDAANEISAAIRRLYDYILLPWPDSSGQVAGRLEIIDLQAQLNTSQNLQERVLDALKNHVFDSITSARLVRLSGLENSDTEYITGDELASYFFRFPNFPKMLGVEPVKKAILKAIEQGILGYVPSMTMGAGGAAPAVENQSLISFNRVIPADELDLSGYLLSLALSRSCGLLLKQRKNRTLTSLLRKREWTPVLPKPSAALGATLAARRQQSGKAKKDY